MVTVIIKKSHQLPMIKPSYYLKQKNVIPQACPPGSEKLFLVTYPFENVVPKIQSHIHGPLQLIPKTKANPD